VIIVCAAKCVVKIFGLTKGADAGTGQRWCRGEHVQRRSRVANFPSCGSRCRCVTPPFVGNALDLACAGASEKCCLLYSHEFSSDDRIDIDARWTHRSAPSSEHMGALADFKSQR